MAINDATEQLNAKPTYTQAQTQSTNQTQTTQATSSKKPAFSLNVGGGSVFGAGISRNLGGEYATSLKKKMDEVVNSLANPGLEVKLTMLDREEARIRYSCLLFSVLDNTSPDTVAVHTLILQATGEDPEAVWENIQQRNVEVLRTSHQANDKMLDEAVKRKIQSLYPNKKVKTVSATVLPRDFNVENTSLVHRVLFNAGIASATELEMSKPDFMDGTIASASDTNLNINVLFNQNHHEDVTGMPVRGDIVVDFSIKEARQQRNNAYRSVNEDVNESKLSTLTGYVDLLWSPVQPQQMHNPYMPQQNMPTQKYIPNFIVTDIISERSYTPGSMLLAIYTALALRMNENWYQAFKPAQVTGTDIRDIGALNIEANLYNEQNVTSTGTFGSRIDTKADTFGLPQMAEYLNALIQPSLAISMDVPAAGPTTWYMEMFLAAATGHQDAINVIIHSADVLTGGLFSRNFPMGSPMFLPVNNTVHVGYYTDRNGTRKDIRDIDYIAVANLLGERDPKMISDWSDTFTRTEYNEALRLYERKKIIMGCTGDSAVFTGLATRVTFSSVFLSALANSIMGAGLKVDISTPLNVNDFYSQRGAANYMSDAMLSQNALFAQRTMGYGGMAGTAMYYQPTTRYN